MKKDRLMKSSMALSRTGAEAPKEILLVPWGHVESENGYFVVDHAGADRAVEAFRKHATDVPIDYEHQSLGGRFASPTGKAPAAGWVRNMVVRAGDGLFGAVEWTVEAAEHIASKAYRYLSPVVVVRQVDHHLLAIHSVGLTNKPAIVGALPIAHRVLASFEDGRADPLNGLREALGMGDHAEDRDVLIAAGRELSGLIHAYQQRELEERVVHAIASGRLAESQRAWALRLLAQAPELFNEWLERAPTLVPHGRTLPPSSRLHNAAHDGVERLARAEYRSQPLLQRLTSEAAYVADQLRRRAGQN